jgi:hypothetical protein
MRPEPRILELYRGRIPLAVFAVWALASALVSLALLGIALGLDGSGRVPPAQALAAFWAGIAAVVVGPVLGAFATTRLLASRDVELQLREDGVSLRVRRDLRFLPWQELDRVVFEAGALHLVAAAGPALVVSSPLMGCWGEELAAHIRDLRRRRLLLSSR